MQMECVAPPISAIRAHWDIMPPARCKGQVSRSKLVSAKVTLPAHRDNHRLRVLTPRRTSHRRDDLGAIAKRILGVKAAIARQGIVFPHRTSGGNQGTPDRLQASYPIAHMGLGRRSELSTQVKSQIRAIQTKGLRESADSQVSQFHAIPVIRHRRRTPLAALCHILGAGDRDGGIADRIKPLGQDRTGRHVDIVVDRPGDGSRGGGGGGHVSGLEAEKACQ